MQHFNSDAILLIKLQDSIDNKLLCFFMFLCLDWLELPVHSMIPANQNQDFRQTVL